MTLDDLKNRGLNFSYRPHGHFLELENYLGNLSLLHTNFVSTSHVNYNFKAFSHLSLGDCLAENGNDISLVCSYIFWTEGLTEDRRVQDTRVPQKLWTFQQAYPNCQLSVSKLTKLSEVVIWASYSLKKAKHFVSEHKCQSCLWAQLFWNMAIKIELDDTRKLHIQNYNMFHNWPINHI